MIIGDDNKTSLTIDNNDILNVKIDYSKINTADISADKKYGAYINSAPVTIDGNIIAVDKDIELYSIKIGE